MNIIPKKKFEHRIRPVTLGKARLREKRLISDAIGRYDQSVFDTACNVFGHHDIELEKVR